MNPRDDKTILCRLATAILLAAAPAPAAQDEPTRAGSVLVYRQIADMEIRDTGEGLAKTVALNIQNSTGLKVAFLARGNEAVTRVPLNMFDRHANDNTTPKAYRMLFAGRWQGVLYRCDRFRYNARAESTVAKATSYTNLRFHGRSAGGKGVLRLRDFTIYRGEDTTPPAAPADLKAAAGAEGVRLSWRRAADNVGIALYVIARAGKGGAFRKVAECSLPQYIDCPPAAGTWRYRVLAVDFQDNLSPWSPVAVATVTKAFPSPKAGTFETDRARYAARIRKIHRAGAGKVISGRVLCFGDSLTGATTYRNDTEAALGRYDVFANGYPGRRTSFGRGRIDQDLREVNPEFCLILLGTNNSKAAQAIPPAMADLTSIADSCATRGTVPVIGTIPPRGFRDPSSAPEARYNAALIEMCRANAVPIASLFEEFQSCGPRKDLLAGDGVHLHKQGFPAVGRAWAKAMSHVHFVLLDRPGGP